MATNQLSRVVPNEVRDFAERSVEQAKRAFGGFIGAVTESLQGEPAQTAAVPPSTLSQSRLAVNFAQRNVRGQMRTLGETPSDGRAKAPQSRTL